MSQATETISLLRKATNTLMKGPVALGLRDAPAPDEELDEFGNVVVPPEEEPFHRIEVVSENDPQLLEREL